MTDGARYVIRLCQPENCSPAYCLSLNSLRQSWHGALNEAQAAFRRLLTSPSSPEWKRVPVPTENASAKAKGKARSTIPELSDVIVHRKAGKGEDAVYRVVLDVPTGDEPVALEAWKAVLATPELRKEWDPAVESASLLEIFDPATRIAKTNFTLGWPAKYVWHYTLLLLDCSHRIKPQRCCNDLPHV